MITSVLEESLFFEMESSKQTLWTLRSRESSLHGELILLKSSETQSSNICVIGMFQQKDFNSFSWSQETNFQPFLHLGFQSPESMWFQHCSGSSLTLLTWINFRWNPCICFYMGLGWSSGTLGGGLTFGMIEKLDGQPLRNISFTFCVENPQLNERSEHAHRREDFLATPPHPPLCPTADFSFLVLICFPNSAGLSMMQIKARCAPSCLGESDLVRGLERKKSECTSKSTSKIRLLSDKSCGRKKERGREISTRP